MSAIGKRYARAAIEAARELDGDAGVQKLHQDVAAFTAAYRAVPELRELLANPALKSEQASALDAVLQKLRTGRAATNLMRILAERDRIGVLDDVAREVEGLADERAGRLRAYVTSAMTLSATQEQRLTKTLEKRFERPVVTSITVDPELLGGLVCQVGDVTLDTSLKRQLEILREQLDAATR